MSILAVVTVGMLVLLAVLVGAWLAVFVVGGDPTDIGAAAAAGGAFLAGLIAVETIRNRRRDE